MGFSRALSTNAFLRTRSLEENLRRSREYTEKTFGVKA